MGLLRTAARAGVAAHVVGNVQRRQQQRWASQDASPAAPVQPVQPPAPVAAASPPPAPVVTPGGADMLAQLQQLGALRDSGVLTESEFEEQKARILGGA